MKTKLVKYTAMAGCLGVLMLGDIALADGWPSRVVGRWPMAANRSIGVLDITSQANSGQCQAIAGTIFGAGAGIIGNNVKGFYCPGSGRIGFVRQSKQGDLPIQFYSGNVSQTGRVIAIGGTVANWDTTGGSLGEYGFFASREDP